MTSIRIMSFGLAFEVLLAPSVTWAHLGNGPHLHLMRGFVRPSIGLDHLLALIAIGLFAISLGGRALWAAPLSFLSSTLYV